MIKTIKTGDSVEIKGYGPFPLKMHATALSQPYIEDNNYCLDVVNRGGIFTIYWNVRHGGWEVMDGYYSMLGNWIYEKVNYAGYKARDAFEKRKRAYRLPDIKNIETKKKYIRD